MAAAVKTLLKKELPDRIFFDLSKLKSVAA